MLAERSSRHRPWYPVIAPVAPVAASAWWAAAAPRPASEGYRREGGEESSFHGMFHCWLEVSAQAQICTWVPEPPKPVSSRHLPEFVFTSSPLDW